MENNGLKIQNHHQALTTYINASLGLPFEWGVRDCVTYAIGAIEAMIGREVDKPKFSYLTQEEALEFAKTWSFKEGMKTQLGAYEVARNFQQPGDIVIIERDGFECAHLVFDRRAYAPLLGGIVREFDTYRIMTESNEIQLLRFD